MASNIAPNTCSSTSTGVPAPRANPGPGARYSCQLRYTDRASKAGYIAAKYAILLRGSVLDVGCDGAPLRALVAQPALYTGVDINPGADVVLNFDRDDLPLADRSFATVVCTDVLEHLERCHAVFDELCRVAADCVLISLPNPLATLVQSLHDGGSGRMKYYGLPVDPPADRHRWFFGFEEAEEFLTQRGARNGFDVEQLDVESSSSVYWRVGREQRDVLDSPQVRAGTTWCVLRRRSGGAHSGSTRA